METQTLTTSTTTFVKAVEKQEKTDLELSQENVSDSTLSEHSSERAADIVQPKQKKAKKVLNNQEKRDAWKMSCKGRKTGVRTFRGNNLRKKTISYV